MWWYEIVGIAGTLLILVSMCINTSSWKGDVTMRAINLVGCVVFMIYGILIVAISTAVLNGLLIIVHTYYLIKLMKNKNKILAEEAKAKEEKVQTTEEAK